MNIAACLALALLGVTPKANLEIYGPNSVAVGQVVYLDASGSVSDLPLVVQVSPREHTKSFVLDATGSVAFVSGKEGVYDLVLVAAGWNDGKTALSYAVSTQKLTVGNVPPPAPPVPPAPTDPIAVAAQGFKADFLAAYATAYGNAASAIHGRQSLVATKQAVSKALSDASSASFRSRFSAYIPNLTPAGQEPTSDAQWQLEEDLVKAISGAFKQ